MKAWEIWTADVHGEHPVVLVSHQARIDAKPEVVVLQCRTMRPGTEREPRVNEVVLDQADGLDWKTLCRCDLLYSVAKGELRQCRGVVTKERRRIIARKIVQGLAIAGL